MICKRCNNKMAAFKEKLGISFVCPVCGKVEFVEFYKLKSRREKSEKKSNFRKM